MLTKVGKIVDGINVYAYVFSENLRGAGLNEGLYPGPIGNSKVKPLKARIAYCLDL